MASATRVQILFDTVCDSLRTICIGKGLNPSILSQQAGLFFKRIEYKHSHHLMSKASLLMNSSVTLKPIAGGGIRGLMLFQRN